MKRMEKNPDELVKDLFRASGNIATRKKMVEMLEANGNIELDKETAMDVSIFMKWILRKSVKPLIPAKYFGQVVEFGKSVVASLAAIVVPTAAKYEEERQKALTLPRNILIWKNLMLHIVKNMSYSHFQTFKALMAFSSSFSRHYAKTNVNEIGFAILYAPCLLRRRDGLYKPNDTESKEDKMVIPFLEYSIIYHFYIPQTQQYAKSSA